MGLVLGGGGGVAGGATAAGRTCLLGPLTLHTEDTASTRGLPLACWSPPLLPLPLLVSLPPPPHPSVCHELNRGGSARLRMTWTLCSSANGVNGLFVPFFFYFSFRLCISFDCKSGPRSHDWNSGFIVISPAISVTVHWLIRIPMGMCALTFHWTLRFSSCVWRRWSGGDFKLTDHFPIFFPALHTVWFQ